MKFKRTSVLIAVIVSSLCLPGLDLAAQTPESETEHAPDGGTTAFIQSIAIPPLATVPFSAVVDTEWTRLMADGSSATIKNHRTVARDSTGRIFEERRAFSPTGDKQPTRITVLEYTDPGRHEFYRCLPEQKTCYLGNYRPSALSAMPAGMSGLAACGCATPRRDGITVQQEALGRKTIQDVEAIGSREITTLPAGLFGNQKTQPVVKEFWYSPRLGLNLVTNRFDPRSGSENFIVNQLSLSEPDPRLFEPPADYQVVREVVVKQAAAIAH